MKNKWQQKANEAKKKVAEARKWAIENSVNVPENVIYVLSSGIVQLEEEMKVFEKRAVEGSKAE